MPHPPADRPPLREYLEVCGDCDGRLTVWRQGTRGATAIAYRQHTSHGAAPRPCRHDRLLGRPTDDPGP